MTLDDLTVTYDIETFSDLLAAAGADFKSASMTFHRMPSACNWNALTAAMFVYQQLRYATPNGPLRSQADALAACQNVTAADWADAIGRAFYGEPWASLQKEFFVA